MITFRITSIRVFRLAQYTKRRHKLINPYQRDLFQRGYAKALRDRQ